MMSRKDENDNAVEEERPYSKLSSYRRDVAVKLYKIPKRRKRVPQEMIDAEELDVNPKKDV